jgi:hypothetical protein
MNHIGYIYQHFPTEKRTGRSGSDRPDACRSFRGRHGLAQAPRAGMCQQPSIHAHDTRQAGRCAEMRHAAAAFPSGPGQWHGQALGSADPAGHWCGTISRKGMTAGHMRIPPPHVRLRADPIQGWSRCLWQQGRPGRSLCPGATRPRCGPCRPLTVPLPCQRAPYAVARLLALPLPASHTATSCNSCCMSCCAA